MAEVAFRQRTYLQAHGHRVDVVSSALYAPAGQSAPEHDPGVTRLDVRPGRFPAYAAGDRWGIRNAVERRRYIDGLRQSSADLVLTHCWQAWNTDWLFDELDTVGKPVALFSHGTSIHTRAGLLGPLRQLRWKGYVGRMADVVQNAAALFVLDAHEDGDRFFDHGLARRLGRTPVTVPNGCAPDLLAAIPNHSSGPPLVLCVAQYTRDKNPAAVVRAFAAVAPAPWCLAICGAQPSALHAQLVRTVGRLPADLRTRIRLHVGLGRAQIQALYRQATIVASASRTECQPLVLLDAMGAGVPFVSSRVGCVPSLPGGMVFDDDQGLNTVLARLIGDADLRQSLGRQGREAAQATYNWSASLAKLERALVRVATGQFL